MKIGFYPKLAFDGIRKNKRMYIPYILTCIGMIMMYYIISFLRYSDTVLYLTGAGTIKEMLEIGSWVIAIFSCIFLFYTNSFLIRRRKKEFGLYNILGMGKRNIGFILLWETLIIAFFSLAVGLFAGFAFSKLAELGLVNMIQGDVNYSLSVSFNAIAMTMTLFGIIFVLLFLNSLRQVRFSSAVSLLKSENIGEKPPKGNWFFGIIGIVILGVAYYIAISIQDPISALLWFFVAVIMVIVGTYLIMVAGSVLFCRILQKRKNYYYKPNHFVSVSSMVYRMKRNGAGLASICILAIMVLVMISSTTCLYFGSEDSLNARYPKEININYRFLNAEDMSDENISALRSDILKVTDSYAIKSDDIDDYRTASIAGFLENGKVECDSSHMIYSNADINSFSNVYQFYFIPLEDYNRMMNTNETLNDNEVLLYVYRDDYNENTISFNGAGTFKIKKHIDKFTNSADAALSMIPSMFVVVPDIKDTVESFESIQYEDGSMMMNLSWEYNFDTGLDSDGQIEVYEELCDFYQNNNASGKFATQNVECRTLNREDYFAMFGGLLYLGIVLSIVFIFAAVLIIYYKQISEGYEDQSRFEIMQKVGMTKREIRKSINSQLLTVFFLPLIGAGLHLAFAFPIIQKILMCFNLFNVTLFAVTTIISFIVFALLYMIVYKITSNAYYNIVSGAKDKV